jgi:hypothetical protein
METQKIKKTIEINAPSQDVWEVLLNDKFTRIWYGEFSEGAQAQTNWEAGSKVVFTDNSGGGMVGKVRVNKPRQELSIEYEGLVIGGKEDYESEDARQVKGGRENYFLAEKDGRTHLSIESDMSPEYFDSMSLAWDKALEKIRELAENLVSVK